MNFNSDLSKSSFPFYNIPGLSELTEDNTHVPPLSGALTHPLHHGARHEAATRILNTPDAAFVSQIVDAFSAPSAEHISQAQQAGCIEGVGNSPLLQAVLSQNPYEHRNVAPLGVSSSIPHVGAHNPHVQNPAPGTVASNFTQMDPTAARVPNVYQGNPNRLPVTTRPIQAVAPQPRVPRMVIQSKYESEHKQFVSHEKPATDSPITSVNEGQEENPKICLKIRRTKKSHKSSSKDKHETSQPVEYGIVSSDDKPPGAGPIKLKIARLKSSTSAKINKGPNSETFKVASLTTKQGVDPNEDGERSKFYQEVDQEQQKAEDAAAAMIRTVFSEKSTPDMSTTAQSSRAKTPKSEKRGNKHKPSKSSDFAHNAPMLKNEQLMETNNIDPTALLNTNRINQQVTPRNDQIMYTPSPQVPHTPPAVQPTVSPHPRLPNSYPMYQQHSHRTNQHPQTNYTHTAVDKVYPPYTPNPPQQPTTMNMEYNSNYPPRNILPGQLFSPDTKVKTPSFPQQSPAWPHQASGFPPNRSKAIPSLPPDFPQAYLSMPPTYSESVVSQQHKVQANMHHQQALPNLPQYNQHDASYNYRLQQQQQQQQRQQQQQQTQHFSNQHHVDHRHNLAEPKKQQFQHPPNTAYMQGSMVMDKDAMYKTHTNQPYVQETYAPNSMATTSNLHQMNPNMDHGLQKVTAVTQPAPPYAEANYSNAPMTNKYNAVNKHRHKHHHSNQSGKVKKRGSQHVRVKFVDDSEETDIFKLSDVMYPDDSEVTSFDELQPGAIVVAKWPMNGKRYSAVVIDPLDSGTGRRFRERKPPPKPFQAAEFDQSMKPSLLLNKLDFENIDNFNENEASMGSEFNAYVSMADRIKLKRREMMLKEKSQGKKRKHHNESADSTSHLIHTSSDEDEFVSPSRKRSHIMEHKKKERRKAVEERILKEDGDGSFRRLSQIIEKIFDYMETLDPHLLDQATSTDEDKKEVLQCLLVSRSRLQELSEETAKLKAMGLLCQLPKKTLVRLLSILEPNILNGVHATPCKTKGNTAEEQRWNRDNDLDRVSSATDAALTVMNIMTAPFMPKAVYLDDVMERSAQLLCRQLVNTIYPEYDPVYKIPSSNKKKGLKDTSGGSTKMKRAHYKGPKNHTILQLYNKLNVLVNQWVELVRLQPLTDTTILQISSVGVSPFFVENVRELQLSSIKLTTALFSKYEKHRTLILEDIFQSLARLPTSKRNLRNYRLTYIEEMVDSSDDEGYPAQRKQNTDLQYIQMVSALILQMIQAIVYLPNPDQSDVNLEQSVKEEMTQKQVDELQVINSYDTAVRTGQNFLSVFLKKCASKSDETDYRPLFENFVHDLLATVNKPEWPASEMILSVLGRLLVHTFSTKSTEMSLRVASLDYLGVVAAKLRRDAVTSNTDIATVETLLQRLEELPNSAMQADYEPESAPMKEDKKVEKNGNKLIERLECLLLAYLRRHASADPSLMFSHNFYIGQWLRDTTVEFQQLQQQEQSDIDAQSKAVQVCQKKKTSVLNLMSSSAIAVALLSVDKQNVSENTRKLLARDVHKRDDEMAAGLTVEDAMLISRHLASTRQFSRAFDCYLSYILRVREESAVALRTRAIKCLAEVVAVDPAIMSRKDIANGVRLSLVDASTSVREAAIDLVGRFILLKPDLVPHYYDMLSARIMDTGVSVRKRVIRILRDLCHEHPQLPQLTDACVKIIRRVNDEEGIKKLVHEVFMKMWFTPVNSSDASLLRNKALLITDIVAANRDHGYEWIEQLFKNLIDTAVSNPQVELACKQIVDCLVQHVILFENYEDKQQGTSDVSNKPTNVVNKKSKERTVRLVATVQTLVQLARIRPRLLVTHVMTLQPYLATKCESSDDLQTVHGVCRVLELAIPLMEHPSEAFLAAVEEDLMRMILTHHMIVVSAAIASLAAITCHVTNNYKLIWDCFQKMCNYLSNARITHEKNPSAIYQTKHFKQLLRALFITGHFCKNFDFDSEKLKGKAQICVKDKVYSCVYYFTKIDSTSSRQETEELCVFALRALGLLMIQDPNMMFLPSTRDLYKTLLHPGHTSDKLKKQVLLNLQTYLQTEDVKMQAATEASIKKAKQDGDERPKEELSLSFDDSVGEQNIKEINDVSSGMASSVMQLFLKEILESFFHKHELVRHAALHTVYLTLQQGLVHPVQCVPYLIAAASDIDPFVHKEAEQQLTELNKRYVGFVHTKALQGMRLAFQLQSYIEPNNDVIRGHYVSAGIDDGLTTLKAKCSHLYQLVRSDRKHRRAFLISLLNLFDDTVKTDIEMLLFLADNLSHFPYHTLDEPLFLISQIEVYVSVSGSNVLQTFKESLQDKSSRSSRRKKQKSEDSSSDSSSSEEDESDESDAEDDSLRHRLPINDAAIVEFARSSLACLLLLWVKQHLKTVFGFKDSKIHQYSTSEVNKANDKQCHRKKADHKFEPKQAIDHIRRCREKLSCRSETYIDAVLRQYTEFNQLMNKLDPNDDDSDSEKEKKVTKLPVVETNTSREEDSDHDSDMETTNAPLDAIRKSTALKPKKIKQKNPTESLYKSEMRKRQVVQYAETSSDSEGEFHGF